jgi:hypothetical protein
MVNYLALRIDADPYRSIPYEPEMIVTDLLITDY